ncbi:MAG: hypothetical protein ACAF41_07400 [Leptolyngbya sp. BL-A-14]
MKPQLLKLLTVGLITLAVFSPALLVWWRIWHYHSVLVEIQQVVRSNDRAALPTATITVPQQSDRSQTNISNLPFKVIASALTPLAFLGFIISVPVGFWAGLWLSDRYRTRRTTMLKQQVATLEKLWQQSLY